MSNKKEKLTIEEMVAQELQIENQMKIISGDHDIKLTKEEESEVDKAKKYLEKTAVEIEKATAGVTNMLAMMKSGRIPATYKDIAMLYANVNISLSQLKKVSDDAKLIVLTDPAVLPSFNYEGMNFSVSLKESTVFDSALWKKTNKAEYDMIRSKYVKTRPLRKIKFESLKGGS